MVRHGDKPPSAFLFPGQALDIAVVLSTWAFLSTVHITSALLPNSCDTALQALLQMQKEMVACLLQNTDGLPALENFPDDTQIPHCYISEFVSANLCVPSLCTLRNPIWFLSGTHGISRRKNFSPTSFTAESPSIFDNTWKCH
jgi:hypothetical protein